MCGFGVCVGGFRFGLGLVSACWGGLLVVFVLRLICRCGIWFGDLSGVSDFLWVGVI